jgi:hypothetical protein
MWDFRLPGALTSLCFVGVVVWTVAFLIPGPPSNETWVHELATAGYGLAGLACWRWIVGNWKAQRHGSFVRGRPSRWMAAASIVTVTGLAALTYSTHVLQS